MIVVLTSGLALGFFAGRVSESAPTASQAITQQTQTVPAVAVPRPGFPGVAPHIPKRAPAGQSATAPSTAPETPYQNPKHYLPGWQLDS
jgi:hypothetical protein